MEQYPKVTIYTVGMCNPDPGPGAYGYLALDSLGQEVHYHGRSYRRSTADRMAIMAAHDALVQENNTMALVEIYTNSEYLVESVGKSMFNDLARVDWVHEASTAHIAANLGFDLLGRLSVAMLHRRQLVTIKLMDDSTVNEHYKYVRYMTEKKIGQNHHVDIFYELALFGKEE